MSFFKSVYHALIDSAPAQIAVAALARTLPPPHVALTHYEVVVPGLPPGLEGLRVLHVSDLHLPRGSELAWQLPEVAAATPHDLAVYTGDFIDDDDGIAPVAALLARMPRVAGAYAVLGNHDYRPLGRAHGSNDVGRLKAELAAAGLEVLSNTARPLTMGLHQYAGVPTFVTRGIGYSGLNLRLGCPAEVALLTLRSPLAAERAA